MRRFRTHWLALMGAMLLLGLSVSSAFGAHPQHSDNRGNAVSSFVHELLFGSDEETDQEDEDTSEEEEEQEGDEEVDEEESDEELVEGEFKNHGHCVREVAWSLEVGGLNENHGGAVSEAARVTCAEDGEDEEQTDGEEGDEGDEGDESLESADEPTARGKSAQAHERAPGKNKSSEHRGNGRGHGRSGR